MTKLRGIGYEDIDPVKEGRDQLADFASLRAGRIDTVTSASDAIRTLGRDRPDLIFISADSAETVADALSQLREGGIDNRVVLVLSPSDAQLAAGALEHGPVFLLPTPLERDDVVSILTLITH